MYIVINKTTHTRVEIEGSFPDLSVQLNKGHRVIIISLYSNTIKVPYLVEDNGLRYWEWENYPVESITKMDSNIS